MSAERVNSKKELHANSDLIKLLCNDEMFADTRRFVIATALLLIGRATLSDLCRVTGLRPNTILYHLKRLMNKNFVTKYRVLENGQVQTVYMLTREGAEHLLRYMSAMRRVLYELGYRDLSRKLDVGEVQNDERSRV